MISAPIYIHKFDEKIIKFKETVKFSMCLQFQNEQKNMKKQLFLIILIISARWCEAKKTRFFVKFYNFTICIHHQF